MKIPTFLDARFWYNYGVKRYIPLDLDSHPHICCVGATSSGKSYALTMLLGRIAIHEQNACVIIVCDFKNASFNFLSGSAGFYGYTNVLDGIDIVNQEFQERLRLSDESRNRRKIILLIDEYAALIGSLPKKDAEEVKQKISNMLMMGRSLGVHLIIGIQRADAEFFKSGSRDQFGAIIMLGNLSKEQKTMLVPDYRDQMNQNNARGEGYMYLDGKGLYHIKVPRVRDPERLHRVIASRLWQPPTPDDGGAGEA